ncbi:MAG: hypothetical protein M1541_21725 [Acidobacteria bacterium]|nr:hypothetical protein [Acidobacteriota bacterium]
MENLFHPHQTGEFVRAILGSAGCFFLMSLGPLFGQGPTLVGTGYSDPSIFRVAPGQITTLFVTGLKTVLSSQPFKAASVPLPVTLAGIAVTLNQPGQQPSPVPLLSVQQLSICGNKDALPLPGSAPDCLITAITVQIPFELLLPPQGVPAELSISENGTVSKAFRIQPITDDLHILNGCDAFPPEHLSLCNSVVTHEDGTPVTSDSPAKAGETVVIYAVGLGRTTPTVKTGIQHRPRRRVWEAESSRSSSTSGQTPCPRAHLSIRI